MESVLALLRERSIRIDNLEISRISDSDAPDAPHHYCALIPIHSRTPLQPGDLRGDLTALPAEELGAYLQRFGKPVTVCPDPAQAAARALAQAGEDDVICAVGSLYMAGAIRTYLRRKHDENSGH